VENKLRIIITVEEFDIRKRYLEYYLARELAALGHRLTILTFTNGKYSIEVLKEGFEIIRLEYLAKVFGYHIPSLKSVRIILNVIGKQKPDVIHCQSLDSPLSFILLFFKKKFSYQIAGSIITQIVQIFIPWNTKKKLLFSFSKILISRFVNKHSIIVFAKTSQLAQIISRSYDIPLSNFRIIPLGSDPDFFRFNLQRRLIIRKNLGFSENNIVILYSGKIDCTKGLDVLVSALEPLITKNNNVKLLIIGKGNSDYIGYLQHLALQYRISNNIIFQPWVSTSELPSFYSASDIAVWPGLSSISIVDAAASGLPLIIASYPVEIFAIENRNGFSFNIGDVGELRNLLKTLINNENLRKEMGERSKVLVEKQLNWRNISLKYYQAYKSMLKNKKSLVN
jgi:glycosyltransferase involved in cell wall biosynthesis